MNLHKFCCFFILFSALVSIADAKSADEKFFSLYDNTLEKKLKLTAEQIEQIKRIRKNNQEKMNVYLMEIDTIHHEMAALVDENNEQIRNILSEKQKIKYDMYQYQLKKQKNEYNGEDKPSRKKMRVY